MRHNGSQYADLAVEWPLYVAKLSLGHQYLYTYDEAVEALAMANLVHERYQFVYAHAGDALPAYVRAMQGASAFGPTLHQDRAPFHVGDQC